ncbi:type VI secretion system Vgr family protein [Variovorax sp. dw_308]|uniref:type VI secretion system Vgr family protein n=1 Tax=Variovorax sp. dw_308 TaxID=2721546 RepID=UPI001C48307B|nr:type VI secretion system Vgr family protein [Variovorax sp. dw_308]
MSGIDVAAAWAELSQANRLYRLQAASGQDGNSNAIVDALRVEGWVQREAISGLFELRIVCLSLDAHLELKSMVGESLTLLSVLANGELVRRSGMVRAAESLGANGGLARYRLTLVPALWLATQQARSQVFQRRTVADIVEQVLAPYADAMPWDYSPEASGFLAGAPERTYCTQYRETDFDFLSRLLAEEGLAWRIEEDEAAPLGHKLILFAANEQQPADPSSPIRFHRKSSQERSDAVQALARRMRHSVAQVNLAAWHVDAKRQVSGSAPTTFPVGGPRAARLEYDDVQGLNDQARNWSDSGTVGRYAGLLMEAAECRADMLIGHSTVRTLRAGTRIEITNAPALGLTKPPHLLLDSIEHVGINNLPRDTAASIAAQLGGLLPYLVFDAQAVSALSAITTEAEVFGLAPRSGSASPDATSRIDPQPDRQALATAQSTGYANSFAGVHEVRPWRPAVIAANGARLHAKPTVHGIQSAIVVGPSGETSPSGADELYCNARGDIRVRFHWQRPEEARDDNKTTRWTRSAQRQAGPGMGWQWIHRIGQEVAVRFADGDIDQPIVVGGLYNGRGEGGIAPTPGGETKAQSDTSVFAQASDAAASAQANLANGESSGNAPAWHGASADPRGHRNAAALTGFKTKEFGGAGYSQLVFDDSDSQLRIQLHASTGHSQLNLGHLIHQKDNYRGSFRGQGLELRTDAYASLRGGKGVLLSTYHGQGGSRLEPTGDFAAGMALMKQVQQLGQALSGAAKTHLTVQMAGHVGATKPNESILDKDKAPYAAMQHAVSGMVDGRDLQDAYSDAADKAIAAGKDKVPHATDAVIAMAAKGGLAMVAGQHVQVVAGETATLATAGDLNFALADALRIHSGQAIGVLAGAQKADAEAGLSVIASKDDLDFQAQHDELKIQAKDKLKIASTSKTVELAAKKKIKVATAQGASIVVENGDITFQCPGTITYYTMQRTLAGPTRGNFKLPEFPDSTTSPLKSRAMFSLGAMPGLMQNYGGEPYTLYADGAVLQKGVTEDDGSVMWDHKESTQQYKVELVTGQVFEVDALETFGSDAARKLANQGYRGFEHEAGDKADYGAEGDEFRKRAWRGKNQD